jgi:hypothetical protein
MSNDILGVLVRQLANNVPIGMQGSVHDLFEKLSGGKGEEWHRQLLKFLRRETVTWSKSGVITIDRTTPFDPVAFIGEGWKIEEEDERSLALTEVDLTAVRFETMLKDRETYVKGETKLERLKKAGHVRLDAKVFQRLWENQYLIPEHWKEKTNGNTTYIFFDGTVLRDSNGNRYVLYLYWRGGAWDWGVRWLGDGWGVRGPSAVLAS